MSNQIYLIYETEGNNPILNTPCYGVTKFEATKEIVLRARSQLNENDNHEPLWLGTLPTREGKTLVYTNPGPDTSSIDIYDVKKVNSWFYGKQSYELGESIYRICYKPIKRSTVMNLKKVQVFKQNIDVRYTPFKIPKRGNDNPHDIILNAIAIMIY